MSRLKEIMRLPAFHLFLFFGFFALFNWPLLTIPDQENTAGIFVYLFVGWGVAILASLLIDDSLRRGEVEGEDGK